MSFDPKTVTSFGKQVLLSTKGITYGNYILNLSSDLANAGVGIFGANTGGEGPELNLIAAEGSIASPTATGTNKILGDFRFAGYTGSAAATGALIRVQQIAAITSSLAPSDISIFQTNTGGVFNNTWKLNNAGYLFGFLTHNPGGASTVNSSNPSFYSGTYTPTITNVQNVNSVASVNGTYMRVGNVVTVCVFADLNTSTGVKKMYFTLPVTSSNFTNSNQGAGALVATPDDTNFYPGTMGASSGSQLGFAQWPGNGSANQIITFTFTYRVI